MYSRIDYDKIYRAFDYLANVYVECFGQEGVIYALLDLGWMPAEIESEGFDSDVIHDILIEREADPNAF